MSPREHRVLAINTGSSSVKAALFEVGSRSRAARRRRTATVSRLGAGAVLRVTDRQGTVEEPCGAADQEGALQAALGAVRGRDEAPDVIGHRIVHGGADHAGPALVDDALLEALHRLTPLAPLHQAAGLRGIAIVAETMPGTPQVAAFDTSFHASMSAEAKRLPLPTPLFDAGVRRYGFHGLSCEHVVSVLPARERGRAIIAHLGSGASVTAVRDGRSVDTTMSFTPSGGLMMATRSGDLDPSVLLYLLDHDGYDVARLQRLVEHESGLVGVSGTTGDMQTLLAVRTEDPAASFAIDVFCRDVRKHVGALATVLGGVDTLVFTGGIGERAPEIRAAICASLTHLGIVIDPERNTAGAAVVSEPGGACVVRIVPADEEGVIARRAADVVFPGAS